MAPKTVRNFGDKGEGARSTRTGKDSGDTGPTGRWPISGGIKLGGKIRGGTTKDAKDITSIAPLDSRGKDKSQSAITNFLTSGAQENGVDISLSIPQVTTISTKENCKAVREETEQGKGSKEGPSGSNLPPIRPQDVEEQLIPKPGYGEEQTVLNGANAMVPNRDGVQLQMVEINRGIQAAHNLADIPPHYAQGI
ncbi:hypothetical protein NDU88_004047 [Pleurodeles waltl]|uniref:Uncharacterized protein n=1 Tax=Pleurodeles waltl TaxID=8319 RepID=A0AAV7TQS7_PLEWA|nr:hypothetical protein NDU88_004047 [Pleurodeles waltl]